MKDTETLLLDMVSVKLMDEFEQAMLRFIKDPKMIPRMEVHSRWIAEDKYDTKNVDAVMLSEIGICT